MAQPSAALPRAVPFLLYIGFLVLASALAWVEGRGVGLAGPDLRWLYAVQVAAVAGCLLAWRRQYVELVSPRARSADWVLGFTIGIAVFALWIHLDHPWMTLGESTGFDPRRPDGSHDWLLVAVRIAGAALVIPVMEELFWRSFVMRWIDGPDFLRASPARTSWRALAISAALFASEHTLWLAGLFAGLAYGWLYIRSGNLWVPVVAHAVTNGLLGAWIVHTGNWRFW